jgi:hypothetical protein
MIDFKGGDLYATFFEYHTIMGKFVINESDTLGRVVLVGFTNAMSAAYAFSKLVVRSLRPVGPITYIGVVRLAHGAPNHPVSHKSGRPLIWSE